MQKSKGKYIVVLFVWFISSFGFAQTVNIPDTKFREYLKGIYPFVMSGDQMMLSYTHHIVGAFNVQGLGIENLEGIQYLTNVTSLNISYNNIKALPETIENLKNLHEFVAVESGLEECPNFRNMPNLEVVYLSSNNLENVEKFVGLPLLSELYLDNNQLVQLPSSLNTCLNLNVLTANDNQLTSLPLLSKLDNMETLTVHNNDLSFEDLELLSHFFPATVIQKYLFPQAEIKIDEEYVGIPEGNSIHIQLPMYSPNSIYNWYYNDHYLKTTENNSLKIDSITLNKTGVYYCEIGNKLRVFRDNHLITSRISVSVDTCIKYTDINYEIVEDLTCLNQGTVSIESIGLESDYTVNYLIKGVNHEYEEVVSVIDPVFSINSGGSYAITLIANDGKCMRSLENILTIDSLDCPKHTGDILQFSPNNDGENDQFLINYVGGVRIYNREAKLVREMNAPVYWDGLDTYNKELTTGVYFIYIEEDVLLEVTLIR